MVVALCPAHHRMVHGYKGKDLDLRLKQIGQRKFEMLFSHDEFMEIFRKNYLEENDDD